MSRRSIYAAIVTAGAACLTLGLGIPAAFAGQSPPSQPQPCSTQTIYAGQNGAQPSWQPTCTPTPPRPKECPPGYVRENGRCVPVVVTPQLQQQEFDITDASALPNGWVLGTGPISILAGLDKAVSGNSRLDILETPNGANGVRINHEPLSGAVIDRTTCSITYDQADLPWSIHQGFGTFAGATGNGYYDLTALFSFPTRDFRCTLPSGLSSGQADWDLNNGGFGLPTVLAYTIGVQAEGRAAVVTTPVPVPTPTQTCPCTQH